MKPWELHPALVHFPIGLLLAGVILDLYAWWRHRDDMASTATGLLIAGVLAGVAAAISGLIAYNTVPAHTAEAHEMMTWHWKLQSVVIALFSVVLVMRWRTRTTQPSLAGRLIGLIATVLLVVGSFLGGQLVYRGGAGVDPELLAPAVREAHHHHGGDDHDEDDHDEDHHDEDHHSGDHHDEDHHDEDTLH